MPPEGSQSWKLLRTWIVAVRPFSFPASVLPFLSGTVCAWRRLGATDIPAAGLGLLAVLLLHAGTNLLNDVHDWNEGVDRTPTPSSGAIVRGWIDPRAALQAAWVLVLAAGVCAVILVRRVGFAPLLPALLGFGCAILYNVRPFRWKRLPLGDVLVFIAFGFLIPLGAWSLQTNGFAAAPLLAGLPFAFWTQAILHANNLRDRTADAARGYRTLAVVLGARNGMRWYAWLLVLACTAALIPVATGVIPAPALAGSITLLPVRGLILNVLSEDAALAELDARTAQLSLVFGLLYLGGAAAGVILH